nr:hypothetical protein [Cellvibrionaceae bacterium]
AYGPECGGKIKLHWLAVRQCYVKNRFSATPHTQGLTRQQQHSDFWQDELGEQTWRLIEHRLAQQGAGWHDYHLVPAHPWQVKKLAPQLKHPLACKDIIDLGQAGDDYQASISVRTLINLSRPEKANIKLPLSMVNTSSLRTIEPHSISTAPVLSQWLSDIVNNDAFFQQQAPLVLLREYAGIRLQAPTESRDSKSQAGDAWVAQIDDKLGVIFRESLEQHQLSSQAVPFMALAMHEQDDLPFIHAWIERYDCGPWLQQLIKTVVLPVWHLLVHHGIALEAHAQNMILIHDNGWPSKIVLRDFHESLEFVDAFVKNPEIAPDFLPLEACYRNAKPNQYYWMDSIEALRELIVDTLFVFNLTELSHLMDSVYGFSEQQFWQQVYLQLQAYQNNNNTPLQRLREVDIYQQTIQTESLLKRKLSETKQQEFHHKIANSLAHKLVKETAVVSSTAPSHQY